MKKSPELAGARPRRHDSTKISKRAMDHYSILDRSSASPTVEVEMPGTSANRSAIASVSAGIAAANAHLPKLAEFGPRFPAEGAGRSLIEMAHSDLDAALQLLVERAEYITAASGAAIALRRGQHNDMLCRASSGSNAPELGALLSMQYGLSGECVRTRRPLRCDDAEHDSRVNREVCRQLSIASVVMMPIVDSDQVLGVFELFSSKPHAFDDRDLAALQRLGEMVETAVMHAAASEAVLAFRGPEPTLPEPSLDGIATREARVEFPVRVVVPDAAPAPLWKDLQSAALEETALERTAQGNRLPETVVPEKLVLDKIVQEEWVAEKPALETKDLEKTEPENRTVAPVDSSKKPLFWSAALQTQPGRPEDPAPSVAVPPVLRNLRMCKACGFPVSQGRNFCIECEEKRWRGQRLPQPASAAASGQTSAQPSAPASDVVPISAARRATVPAPPHNALLQTRAFAAIEPGVVAPQTSPDPSSDRPDLAADFAFSGSAAPFLSSAVPSESWFAANKYILGALLFVVVAVAAIIWLR